LLKNTEIEPPIVGIPGRNVCPQFGTREEVEEFLDSQRGQLELRTMFEILATTEAILRLEVRTRAIK